MRPLRHPLSTVKPVTTIQPVKTERGMPAPWHKNTVKRSRSLNDINDNEGGMDQATDAADRAFGGKRNQPIDRV